MGARCFFSLAKRQRLDWLRRTRGRVSTRGRPQRGMPLEQAQARRGDGCVAEHRQREEEVARREELQAHEPGALVGAVRVDARHDALVHREPGVEVQPLWDRADLHPRLEKGAVAGEGDVDALLRDHGDHAARRRVVDDGARHDARHAHQVVQVAHRLGLRRRRLRLEQLALRVEPRAHRRVVLQRREDLRLDRQRLRRRRRRADGALQAAVRAEARGVEEAGGARAALALDGGEVEGDLLLVALAPDDVDHGARGCLLQQLVQPGDGRRQLVLHECVELLRRLLVGRVAGRHVPQRGVGQRRRCRGRRGPAGTATGGAAVVVLQQD
mmetsp:Transcript_8309/g.25925  ORF Transcript_8309/g.25925 Transcript_8309/m.25925 type:complete len:327 (+) Transcript_8309:177-1157(+)